MKLRRIIICVLCINMLMLSFSVTFVSALDNECTVDITEVIPIKAKEFARDRLLPLSNSIYSDTRFDINIKSLNDLKLEKPYVIYSANNLGVQDKIYYFPVSENNRIQMIMSIIDVDGDYTATMSKDIANSLNEINYLDSNKHYILYQNGQEILAENENSTFVLTVTDYETNIVNKTNGNSEYFESLSFSDKVKKIKNTYAIRSINTSENFANISGAQGFSVKNACQTKLNTSGCLVPQGSLNICWAASVATTVRYLKYDKYKNLTATQVCDAIGVSYTANNIDAQQKALKKYGINYNQKITEKQIGFAVVQRNILSQNTVLIHAFPSSGDGHAVTIIGYSTYGGVNLITIYNSATNACETVEYKSSGTYFSFNNKNHLWKYSLYWKA